MFEEDLAQLTNVIRFPVELRVAASVELLDGLEPDPREVAHVAAVLGLDLPPASLFGRVDEETARHIAEQVLPLARHERLRALDSLLRPVVAAAAEACRRARDAADRALEARSAMEQAFAMGGDWVESLERTAERRLREAAACLIEAHGRCRTARGVGRAVALARRGEAWAPQGGWPATEWPMGADRALGRP